MADRAAQPKAVTSADVARLAEVSRATVSFVLNDTEGHRVSDRTRDRVLAAARQLGYVPHAAARTLRAGRSNLVLLPASVSAIGRLVSEWIDALHDALDRRGYVTVMHTGRFDDPVDAARAWAELRPVAVLALDGEGYSAQAAEVLKRAGVRAQIVAAAQPVPGTFTVPVDHRDTGAAAVEHLIARGRTRIGVIMPRERGLGTFAQPRLEGAKEVAARRMATVVPVELAYSHAGAAELAARWPDLGLDAVFAYNDEYAALLMHMLRGRGLSVPQDVAVVGADDLVLAGLQDPPLSTVRLELPSAELVAGTLERLLETGSAEPIPRVEAQLMHRLSS